MKTKLNFLRDVNLLAVFISVLLISSRVFAQAGSLDPTFGKGGVATDQINTAGSGAINSITLQTDGKIVAAGYFDEGTKRAYALTRYNTDGSIDKTFGVQGYVIINATNTNGYAKSDIFYCAANSVQNLPSSDGFVAAGYTILNGHYTCSFVFLNPDGTLKRNYQSQSSWGGISATASANDQICNSVAVTDNGEIVAVGYSADGPEGSNKDFLLQSGIVNLTTPVGNSMDVANAVVLQHDQKIISAGYTYNGHNYDFALVRYDYNGNMDTTFGSDRNGIVTTQVGDVPMRQMPLPFRKTER